MSAETQSPDQSLGGDQIRVSFDYADDAYLVCDYCARQGIREGHRVAGDFDIPGYGSIDELIQWKRDHVAKHHRVVIDAE